jgi:hypothetical protein
MLVMIQDGVDVVDDVGLPPSVPLPERGAVVEQVLVVVVDGGAAVRTRKSRLLRRLVVRVARLKKGLRRFQRRRPAGTDVIIFKNIFAEKLAFFALKLLLVLAII